MKKLLIVDDQKGIRLLLKEVFTREGYQVYLASNGIEALNYLETESIHCVILDMKIPGMNGLEIMRNINEMDYKIPVFMMTAFGEEELIKEAHALGIVKFFTKPFDVFEIRDDIKMALEE